MNYSNPVLLFSITTFYYNYYYCYYYYCKPWTSNLFSCTLLSLCFITLDITNNIYYLSTIFYIHFSRNTHSSSTALCFWLNHSLRFTSHLDFHFFWFQLQSFVYFHFTSYINSQSYIYSSLNLLEKLYNEIKKSFTG